MPDDDPEVPCDACHRRAGSISRVAQNRALQQQHARQTRLRGLAFLAIIVGVLGVGSVLAFGDFFNRPSGAATAGVIDVQSSMAGFNPSEIHIKAGQTVTLRWWTQDASPHLQGGAHTMVAPDLGLDEALPAESTRLVTWTVPDKPGTYDVYCDSCCGGKDSPTMHGKFVVEPVSASVESPIG